MERTARGAHVATNLEKEESSPFNASGEALKPIAKLSKAALDRGLYLMTHWNVVMICPPLVITREEIEEGLAALDEALVALVHGGIELAPAQIDFDLRVGQPLQVRAGGRHRPVLAELAIDALDELDVAPRHGQSRSARPYWRS